MAGELRKKGLSPENRVPWLHYHVHENMVTLSGQRLLSIVRFKGVSYGTKEKPELNKLFNNENRFFLSLGKKEGKNLMIQTWTTKSSISLDAEYKMELPVFQDFVDTYTAPFRKGKYRQVGYTVAFILKYKDLDEGIGRMNDILIMVNKMLNAFEPSVLGMEESANGSVYSQVGRYVSMLLNGEEQNVMASSTRLGDAVIDSVTNFAPYDYVENRPNSGGARYATTYDLRDYPAKTVPGMWDEAIEEQFDFTLVQTFMFEDRNKSKVNFKKQTVDLTSAEGETKQTKQLEDAVQDITQGDKLFGRYHAALIVYGETPQKAIENGATLDSIFSARDTRFIRSTVTNDDTYYSLFPGCTIAMYPVPKSTENLACGFSLHASPVGKADGNPPGDGKAWMPFRSVTDALYFFNAHNSPVGKNNTGERMPGHVSVVGMTGTGKTTLEGGLVLFASRWNPMYFCLDYNRSFENLLRALDTQYYVISPGEDTGINLFQLEDTPALRTHLFDQVLTMAGGGSEAEQKQIRSSIDAVMSHSVVENRGMSLLLQNIAPTEDENCLHVRLAKWCRICPDGSTGRNAWVCDAAVNRFDPMKFRRLAFDCTQIMKKSFFMKNRDIMEIFLNNMFFLKRMMHESQPGNMLINMIAECWIPLTFESTADSLKEVLKAGRTRGEILIMDTQSPEDLSESEHAPAVIQQVITQIWLANDKADEKQYAKFNIKGKEFEIISNFNPLAREFLIKQGQQSTVLSFDLPDDLKYWLPILSTTIGKEGNAAIAASVRERLGTDDPAKWVHVFLDEIQRMKQKED
ncbi:TPA: VirB4 family type IV secretion system protein [Enterobacter hormaechei subsp. steigerwaltii]